MINMTGPSESKDISVATLARRAREASRVLAILPDAVRRDALVKASRALVEQKEEILTANGQDCELARIQVEQGSSVTRPIRWTDAAGRELQLPVLLAVGIHQP